PDGSRWLVEVRPAEDRPVVTTPLRGPVSGGSGAPPPLNVFTLAGGRDGHPLRRAPLAGGRGPSAHVQRVGGGRRRHRAASHPHRAGPTALPAVQRRVR